MAVNVRNETFIRDMESVAPSPVNAFMVMEHGLQLDLADKLWFPGADQDSKLSRQLEKNQKAVNGLGSVSVFLAKYSVFSVPDIGMWLAEPTNKLEQDDGREVSPLELIWSDFMHAASRDRLDLTDKDGIKAALCLAANDTEEAHLQDAPGIIHDYDRLTGRYS